MKIQEKFLVLFEGENFESFRQLGSRCGNSPDFDDRPALISEARRISSNVSQRNTPFPRFILFDLLSPAWETIIGEVGNYRTSTRTSSFPVSAVSNRVFLPSNDIPNLPWRYHAMYDIYFITFHRILYRNIIFLPLFFFFINNYLRTRSYSTCSFLSTRWIFPAAR